MAKKIEVHDIVQFKETRQGENGKGALVHATVKQLCPCGCPSMMIIPWSSGHEFIIQNKHVKYVRKGKQDPWGNYV